MASKFIIRVGSENNPIVFPHMNNFSYTLLEKSSDGYTLNHAAIGSDLFRYSPDYGKTWSSWENFAPLSYLKKDSFKNKKPEHVIVDYWCKKCKSVSARVYGELSNMPSIFPNLFVQGEYNMHGLDQAIDNKMTKIKNGFVFPFVWNFPTELVFDIWGDGSVTFGDIDEDGVLDRLPPNSQLQANIKLSSPPQDFVGWTIIIGDDFKVKLEPSGSWVKSIVVFLILLICPIFGAFVVIYAFRKVSYAVIINISGNDSPKAGAKSNKNVMDFMDLSRVLSSNTESGKTVLFKPNNVLIATLEYEIPDWKIKVRIGGLGVMSSLIGNHLTDTKLYWVVPMIFGNIIV